MNDKRRAVARFCFLNESFFMMKIQRNKKIKSLEPEFATKKLKQLLSLTEKTNVYIRYKACR